MAIASIVAHSLPEDLAELHKSLLSFGEALECRTLPPDKLAATLECPGERLPSVLKKIAQLPKMLDMELVFASYEDDLDDAMPMPNMEIFKNK